MLLATAYLGSSRSFNYDSLLMPTIYALLPLSSLLSANQSHTTNNSPSPLVASGNTHVSSLRDRDRRQDRLTTDSHIDGGLGANRTENKGGEARAAYIGGPMPDQQLRHEIG